MRVKTLNLPTSDEGVYTAYNFANGHIDVHCEM